MPEQLPWRDPAASLAVRAVEFDVGPLSLRIPALPAADWLPVLWAPDPGVALLGLADDADALDAALLSGELSPDELVAAVTDVVEVATGRSMRTAIVLALLAESAWTQVSGDLAMRGFRWDQMSIGAALDAIHHLITRFADEETREKIRALLAEDAGTTGGAAAPVAPGFAALAGAPPIGAGVVNSGGEAGSARSGLSRAIATRSGETPPTPRPPRRPRRRAPRSAAPTPLPPTPAGNAPVAMTDPPAGGKARAPRRRAAGPASAVPGPARRTARDR